MNFLKLNKNLFTRLPGTSTVTQADQGSGSSQVGAILSRHPGNAHKSLAKQIVSGKSMLAALGPIDIPGRSPTDEVKAILASYGPVETSSGGASSDQGVQQLSDQKDRQFNAAHQGGQENGNMNDYSSGLAKQQSLETPIIGMGSAACGGQPVLTNNCEVTDFSPKASCGYRVADLFGSSIGPDIDVPRVSGTAAAGSTYTGILMPPGDQYGSSQALYVRISRQGYLEEPASAEVQVQFVGKEDALFGAVVGSPAASVTTALVVEIPAGVSFAELVVPYTITNGGSLKTLITEAILSGPNATGYSVSLDVTNTGTSPISVQSQAICSSHPQYEDVLLGILASQTGGN